MVRNATRIFIPTQFQNASPARQDEPGFNNPGISRSPLIPFFIKIAFNEKKESERFYLILADSGMGKTTFLINLYIRYHSFFNWRRKYAMRLFRIPYTNVLTEISSINKEDAKNTILLLDALDEDPNIVSKGPNMTDAQAFEKRVDEIIEASRDFRDVVITCRTQYFPGQEKDPYHIKLPRPDGKGDYVLNKLYLSPFSNQEVKGYLNKKYGRLAFWNRSKKIRAARIVRQSRYLVVRPMMLSYIDLLVGDNRRFESVFEIYETLVEKWLLREAEKRKRIKDQKAFTRNLREVSRRSAIAIYQNWRAEDRMYLTKKEAVAIADQHGIGLRPEEVTGQSLLTCDGEGHWKFAHKSILEFFLAEEALHLDSQFLGKFNFSGMDMAKAFFEEKNPEKLVFIEGGAYARGEGAEKHEVILSGFWMGKYPVTQADYVRISGKADPSRFKGNDNNPVENLFWFDAAEYCNRLNKKYGYSEVYDAPGNLLDTDGNPTNDVTKVRGFRLPTEAEWEYAARGGNQSKGYGYSGSNEIKEVAWYEGNSGKKTHPVGGLKPNELGLYDMSGNVWEWCHDWYHAGYYNACKAKGKVNNPSGPESGTYRVVRGGSWRDDAHSCRAAGRSNYGPYNGPNRQGIRLVFVP